MTLEEHRAKVKPHLDLIQAGAEIAARHVRMLPHKMPYPTSAEDELAETQQTLERALERIKAARAAYEAKPLETV